ncbi:hypothetical protein [Roseimaritima ulvae]|uniref:Uncharacterized protein n=1 Tax=Roseimaritima ulvae TaxID=980254 RepID=A0A5B9QVF0_9BACT|nr:hypothetical protein [Roseimaritima ulvae]QEG41066.1 hypothetical protein UC8_30840 [Roseimaritima ulvae]
MLYALPSLLSLLFYAAVLIVLAVRPSDGSRAKLFAILGTLLLLINAMGGWALQVLISQFVGPEQIALAFGVFAILHSLLYFAGLSLVFVAVFTGRRPAASNAIVDTPGGHISSAASDNPYVPPAN